MQRRFFLTATAAALAAAQQPAFAGKPGAKLTAKATIYADPSNGQLGATITMRDSSGVLEALSPNALAGTLLEVKNANGGRFAKVTHIQRVDTWAGLKPTFGPTKVGETIKVPYQATYIFWGDR